MIIIENVCECVCECGPQASEMKSRQMNMNRMKRLFEFWESSVQRYFYSDAWMVGLSTLSFIWGWVFFCVCNAIENEEEAPRTVSLLFWAGKTYLISQNLMGSLVCDILRRVCTQWQSFLWTNRVITVIRIHCCQPNQHRQHTAVPLRGSFIFNFNHLKSIHIFITHWRKSRLQGEYMRLSSLSFRNDHLVDIVQKLSVLNSMVNHFQKFTDWPHRIAQLSVILIHFYFYLCSCSMNLLPNKWAKKIVRAGIRCTRWWKMR